ncbi:CE1759 family FMN reductase [Kitasatospora sp. NPDC048365]|uniref:CE1759 family FMN reductase n=1 Tax=Kitasatospora sp. NPDC048365 TaxID=3364050 RepID=UPI003724A9D3
MPPFSVPPGPARQLTVLSGGLSGSSSTRRLADCLTDAVLDRLATDGVTAVTHTVELRDLAHDLADHQLTGLHTPALADTLDHLAESDAVIAATPILHASFGGLFKSFLDTAAPGAFTGRPVLLAASGGSLRHCLVLDHALRPLFTTLGARLTPTSVYATPADWAGPELPERIIRAATELCALLPEAPPVPTRPRGPRPRRSAAAVPNQVSPHQER